MLTLLKNTYSQSKLPSGSFSLDRNGDVVATTLPTGFPRKDIREIGLHAMRIFQTAKKAQLPLAEITATYPTIKFVAKELRGGVIVYLKPLTTL